MRKISSWTKKVNTRGSNSNLFGFKVVKNIGTLTMPNIKSINFDFKWKPGIHIAENMDGRQGRGDAFFHMYTSILDAIASQRTSWTQWPEDSHDKNYFILAVRPIGEMVFGLDNDTTLHTFGAKKIKWEGSLIQPGYVQNLVDIYNISDGSLRLVYKYINIHNFAEYI
jgi:hypothetical protein